MTRVCRALLLAAVAWTVAAPLVAQERSPIASLLRRAFGELEQAHFAVADSLARQVLARSSEIRRADQISALQVLVAALYPDLERLQHRDSALVYLRRLVRMAPDSEIPPEMRTYALDDLIAEARRTTFAVRPGAQREYSISGLLGEVAIDVRATRPARFVLTAAPASGEGPRVFLDSLPPVQRGVLRFRVVDGEQPRLASGVYSFTITATDSATADTVSVPMRATIVAPPLEFVPVPAALDSSQLLPTRARPTRGTNLAVGVGLGGATVLLAQALRAPAPVTLVSADGRSYVVAAGMVVGGIVAALVDRGRPLPANVQSNQRLQEDFARAVLDARAENDRRRAAYRATITIEEAP